MKRNSDGQHYRWYENGYYYTDAVSNEMVNKISNLKKLKAELSSQETQLLVQCCTDLTYTQIADELGIGVNTLDACRAALFKKLNIKSRSGLVVFAMSMGLGE